VYCFSDTADATEKVSNADGHFNSVCKIVYETMVWIIFDGRNLFADLAWIGFQ